MKIEEVESGHIDIKQEMLPSEVVASVYATTEVGGVASVFIFVLN